MSQPWSRGRRWAERCALAGLLVLAGCATPGSEPEPFTANQVVASGRLAVRVEGNEQRTFSSQFELAGSPQRGRLVLSTPLGTQLAQATWQPGRAWLEEPQRQRSFDNVDALAEAVMGEPVPLTALFDWLAGRPSPAAPSRDLTPPAQGFEQMGWTVQLEALATGVVVATRAQAPRITVRAKLDAPAGQARP